MSNQDGQARMGFAEEMGETTTDNDIVGEGALGGTTEVPTVTDGRHPHPPENMAPPMELTLWDSGLALPLPLDKADKMLTMTQLMAGLYMRQAETMERPNKDIGAGIRCKMDVGAGIGKGNGQENGCYGQ